MNNHCNTWVRSRNLQKERTCLDQSWWRALREKQTAGIKQNFSNTASPWGEKAPFVTKR